MIFGDFYFVEKSGDRLCKASGQHTGNRDALDAKMLRKNVLLWGGLFEIEQEHHTYEGGRALSELGRVYASWHACDQLDHVIECSAAGWHPSVCDHHPVVFARLVESYMHVKESSDPWHHTH